MSFKRLFCALGLSILGMHVCFGAVGETPAPQVLSLDDCLRIAMEKNRRRPASEMGVAMAEAMHRQALSGYWPRVTAKAGLTRMDEPADFRYPQITLGIPSQSISVPGGTTTVAIPANAFGPGFPPAAIQVPVAFPGQTVTTQPQIFQLPEQRVKLAARDTATASAQFEWLLFDGGMRKGYRQQAGGAVDLAKTSRRRTDLEIADSVVRIYYGAILARQLRQIGEDTLARMEVTLQLTESLYKNGSERVNKTDYLDNQVMVESLRAAVATLARNEASAEAALAYTMGLEWNATVRPADSEVPHRPFAGNVAELVSEAYQFNPDWASLDAGLKALEGALTTARSGYYPKIAVAGELHRWWNDYDSGISTPANKTGWSLSLGAEIPVFNGFLTGSKVAEARARLNKLKEEKVLLREGLGLRLRDLFLSLDELTKAYQATARAMTAAQENRDLTSRAYQNELIETEKVIRAQLFEAFMSAQHLKTRYDYLAVETQISLTVGREIQTRLSSKP